MNRRRQKKMYKEHPQKSILLRTGGERKRISCDRKMIPLVRLLNKRGFTTNFSCQGGKIKNSSCESVGYVSFQDKNVVDEAVKIIRGFRLWRDRTISVMRFDNNVMACYAYNDRQLEFHRELGYMACERELISPVAETRGRKWGFSERRKRK